MRNYITGGFSLLLLCVGSVHAQQASPLQVGKPVKQLWPPTVHSDTN